MAIQLTSSLHKGHPAAKKWNDFTRPSWGKRYLTSVKNAGSESDGLVSHGNNQKSSRSSSNFCSWTKIILKLISIHHRSIRNAVSFVGTYDPSTRKADIKGDFEASVAYVRTCLRGGGEYSDMCSFPTETNSFPFLSKNFPMSRHCPNVVHKMGYSVCTITWALNVAMKPGIWSQREAWHIVRWVLWGQKSALVVWALEPWRISMD